MKLVDRHLLGSFVPPFLFGLTVTTFLLMTDVLQDYINLFLEKGIRVDVATEILVLSLGHTFALTVPMAVLVGVLMGVGHLAVDHEITALKACGVSLYRLAAPLLVAGSTLAVAMVAYNHYVLPDSNHRLRTRLFEIHQLRPTLEVKPNVFAEINPEYTIFVRDKDDRTGVLEDVVLYQREGRGDPAPDVIVARHGRLITMGPGAIRLDLFDGEIHRLPDPLDPLVYNRTRFARQTFVVDLDDPGARLRRAAERGEREMDLDMLALARAEQDSLARVKRGESERLLRELVEPAFRERSPDTAVALAASRGSADTYRSWLGLAESRSRSLSLTTQVEHSHRLKAKRYSVEWHKKFSIPFACVVFVLLGIPLAIVSARGGRGVSVGLSLVAFILYYVFISTGEKLADRGHLTPWLAMWTPNLVLGTVGLVLLYQAVQETRVVQVRLPTWTRRFGSGPS